MMPRQRSVHLRELSVCLLVVPFTAITSERSNVKQPQATSSNHHAEAHTGARMTAANGAYSRLSNTPNPDVASKKHEKNADSKNMQRPDTSAMRSSMSCCAAFGRQANTFMPVLACANSG